MDFKNKQLTWNGHKIVRNFVVNTKAELDALDIRLLSNKDECKVIEDNKIYEFDSINAVWVDITSGSSSLTKKEYKGNIDSSNSLIHIASDLTFSIIKNTDNDLASLSVKSTVSGTTIPILVSFSSTSGDTPQSAQFNTFNITTNDTYQVIDNTLGSYSGGSFECKIITKDININTYDLSGLVTNISGTNNSAEIGSLIVN